MTQNQTIGREAAGKAKEEDVAKPKEDAFRVRKAPPDFQGVPSLPLLHQSSSPFLSLISPLRASSSSSSSSSPGVLTYD